MTNDKFKGSYKRTVAKKQAKELLKTEYTAGVSDGISAMHIATAYTLCNRGWKRKAIVDYLTSIDRAYQMVTDNRMTINDMQKVLKDELDLEISFADEEEQGAN